MIWPLLLVTAWLPVIKDECFIIEVNRAPWIHQLIFWDYDKDLKDLVVVDWRQFDESKIISRTKGGFVCRWREGKYIREVRASVLYRTQSAYDPERVNLRVLPAHKRRGLRRP